MQLHMLQVTSKFIENWTDYIYHTEKLQGKSTIIIVREETVAHVFVGKWKNTRPRTTSLTKRCFLLGSLQNKNVFLCHS